MGFVEHDKSKLQFRRDEYIAARIGQANSLFKIAKVELLAVSFVDSYEDIDGLCKSADTWTELFTLDGTYVGRLDAMAMNYYPTIREFYASHKTDNKPNDGRTEIDRILNP